MDVSLSAAYARHLKQRLLWVEQAVERRAAMQPYFAAIEAVATAVDAYLSVGYGDEVTITFATSDVKGAGQRLLDAIQRITGKEFASSHDYAEEYAASRTFQLSDLPLQVVLAVPQEDTAEGCRRVQVGVKEVPVYELRCDDEEGSPKP